MPRGHYDRSQVHERQNAVASSARFRLVAPHGFIDENGRHRYWNPGDIVSEPAEVEMLKSRQAPIEPIG